MQSCGNGSLILQECVKWSSAGIFERIAVCELVGWRNAKGNATPMGKKIARTDWNKLSYAAKNVLTRYGVTE